VWEVCLPSPFVTDEVDVSVIIADDVMLMLLLLLLHMMMLMVLMVISVQASDARLPWR
jgi:hypothetical protein